MIIIIMGVDGFPGSCLPKKGKAGSLVWVQGAGLLLEAVLICGQGTFRCCFILNQMLPKLRSPGLTTMGTALALLPGDPTQAC